MRARRVLGVLSGPAVVWLSGARGTSVVWAAYPSALSSVGPTVHCHPAGAADWSDGVLDVAMHCGLRVHVAGLCPEDAEALVLTVDHRQPAARRPGRWVVRCGALPGAARVRGRCSRRSVSGYWLSGQDRDCAVA